MRSATADIERQYSIGITAPVWSNVAYPVAWVLWQLGYVHWMYAVAVTLIGIASALFHYYELELKVFRLYNPAQWQTSIGYVWQRIDIITIYLTFSVLFGLVIQSWLLGTALFIFANFAAHHYNRRRIEIIVISALPSVVACLLISWELTVPAIILFAMGGYLRRDAYGWPCWGEKVNRSNKIRHSLWHPFSAAGLHILAVIITAYITGNPVPFS